VDDSQAHGIEERFDLECNSGVFLRFCVVGRKGLLGRAPRRRIFNDLAYDVDDACVVVLMFPRRVGMQKVEQPLATWIGEAL